MCCLVAGTHAVLPAPDGVRDCNETAVVISSHKSRQVISVIRLVKIMRRQKRADTTSTSTSSSSRISQRS